jgi:hypothetical protein
MVARLRTKPGSGDIGVTIGEFVTTRVSGSFKVIYLLRNTIMNLTTQDEQVRCFCNVAAHLEPGGCFVIEVVVPELQRLPPAKLSECLPLAPLILVSTCTTSPLETFSSPFRYVWPSELDLVARLAGMRLRERWSDWTRALFTSNSRQHISVWQKCA